MPDSKAKPRATFLVREVEKLTVQMPELSEMAAFYRAAFPLFSQYQETVPPLHLENGVVQNKLLQGIPVFVGEALPLDLKATRNLFLALCRLLENPQLSDKSWADEDQGSRPWMDVFSLWRRAHDEGNGIFLRAAAAQQIRKAVERRELNLEVVWAMLASGDWHHLELAAVERKLDPGLLRVLARYSLQPAFQRWASDLQESQEFDQWQHNICPLCGSLPTVSEIRGKEGARFLRCGLCGAGWRYPLLKCAFCQHSNYRQLRSLRVEEEEERYVQACEDCQGYIKMIKTFDPIPADLLSVYDLATLHLDLIAEAYPYTRGSLTA